jgi:hypothetical protein
MTTTGLLALGAAEVIDRRTQNRLGYVYTTANDQGQLQRWLLFRHPHNELEIRSPPEDMARWTLDDWQAHVEELWQPNGYYVWAQANAYEYDGTYDGVTWKQLPDAEALPQAAFPERPGSNYQIDYLEGKVIDVVQDASRGRAYVVRGLSSTSSIEYWLLPAHYEPAGRARTEVLLGRESAANLTDFVELCRPSWEPGSTLIVTGCLNYTAEAPPFAP